VTRFVWSGDQILWEVKDATGSYAADAGGRVSYAHAGGIDRPLAIWKQGVGTLVTHQNWRGQFAMGTFTSGAPSDCLQYPPSGCVPVSWPGWSTTAWHEKAGTAPTTGYEHYWMGSLAVGMRDASGQMYMRNRYYDPQTGQFTQPDPIGLAGGLNAYGFANGDPVSYSDPYGLGGCSLRNIRECLRAVRESRFSMGDVLNTLRAPQNMPAIRLTISYVNDEVADPSRAGYTDEVQNAFRHVTGSCQLYRNLGGNMVEVAATLAGHEFKYHKKNETERQDSEIDMHNNEVGVRAAANRTNETRSCAELGDEALTSGAARVN
jgi:RHS repeat-associated protein